MADPENEGAAEQPDPKAKLMHEVAEQMDAIEADLPGGFTIGRVITVVEVRQPDGNVSLRVRAEHVPVGSAWDAARRATSRRSLGSWRPRWLAFRRFRLGSWPLSPFGAQPSGSSLNATRRSFVVSPGAPVISHPPYLTVGPCCGLVRRRSITPVRMIAIATNTAAAPYQKKYVTVWWL